MTASLIFSKKVLRKSVTIMINLVKPSLSITANPLAQVKPSLQPSEVVTFLKEAVITNSEAIVPSTLFTLPAQNSELRTQNSELKTPNSELPTQNSELKTPDSQNSRLSKLLC